MDDRWRFWVDRGGTFTDVIGRSPDGRLRATKVLSNDPTLQEDAVIAGIRQLLRVAADAPLPLERIAEVRVGTTVATNALVERKGAATLFVTNDGLADVLEIGDQARPDIFALNIQKPSQLYARVATTPLRQDVDGHEVATLDEGALSRAFDEAREAGCTSCAIALMHAWRHGEQESRVAELARAAGFECVATSHEASPLMGLVPRAATTVAEAYLAPILRRYTSQLAEAFPGVPLGLMKSDGGLSGTENFAAHNALLSGPAGGVVGAIETAHHAGFERVIAFDMGGTSTDVSHYAGTWERHREEDLAGVHLAIPMLAVETIAAGGGSIVVFDGGRLTVGPASAGADPGPACYRRGGPLTVTDCNLLLGRISADYFPSLFGSNGDEPLDEEATKKAFDELAERMDRTPEEAASGALAIAIEHMAAAIRRISIARGHDPTECVLNAFGGAGGQHACSVADALGIETILLHPLAGVLSALGIGLSARTVLLERGLEADLPQGYDEIRKVEQELRHEAGARLTADLPGSEDADVTCTVTALVRYAGSETALPVDFGDADEIVSRFVEAHRAHFGFALESPVVVASLRAEARVQAEAPQWEPAREGETPEAEEKRPVFFSGEWIETPFYKRSRLPRGARLAGPAVLVEPTSTTLIEPGWSGEVGREGELALRRKQRSHSSPGPGQKAGSQRSADVADQTERDPVQLELMGARFMAIAVEMGEALRASAQSVNVRERRDFSCALFGPDGSLVANAPHIPVHLGAMGATVRALLSNGEAINRGDVWITNDVYHGGSHLPDVTVITPVFADGDTPAFFVASRAHHADIGGITPGSMPAESHRIEEEGVLIALMRLVSGGEFRETDMRAVLEGARYPTRNADRNLADFRAQVAANARGMRGLLELAESHGLENVQAYMQHVVDYAEESVRRALRQLSENGKFEAPLDDGSHIAVAVTVDREKGEATFDFAGTSAVRDGNFNAPRAVVRATVLYVLRTLIAEPIPLNDGCLVPVNIRIPEGSMLDPQWPHAVVAGNVEISDVLTDVLLAALGKVAACEGTMNNLTFGNRRVQHYETIAGGIGAGDGFDGASAVHAHMSNTKLTDPELLEFRFPVTLEEFAVRRNSGGRGRWKGGDGIVRRIRFNEAMTVTILANRRRTDPFGLAGGGAGARGKTLVNRVDGSVDELDYAETAELAAGDAVEVRSPGGGGFGAVDTGQ